MVTVTIDGTECQVGEGLNLVEAALLAGVEIPTFCYHPGLTIVGQCRICFVEIEGMPRLVTACSTPVNDGMVVHTASERVQEARAAVMEFLLANHPLDCPVCDQAGECFLQDFSMEHGADTTHMVDIKRTYKGYERRQIGPHVVQNQNRCIHCTRCIRFTREISETHDLSLKARGNHTYIDTFNGEPLDNPWSACVADVCPVGALTVREFRFRARVWHLKEEKSICPGCSIGCAISVGHLDNIVHRFTPRANIEINGWWMCDHGRFLAESINERQIDTPLTHKGNERSIIDWSDAIKILKELSETKGARVVASAALTNEGLLLAKKIFKDHLGLEVVVPVHTGVERRIKNGRGEWLSSVEQHPNINGARLIGFDTVDEDDLHSFLMTSTGPIIILDNGSHPWLMSDEAQSSIANQRVAVTARLHSRISRQAELVIPAASWVETEGSYISNTGRVQLARRAFAPRGQARPVWQILALLAASIGLEKQSTTTVRTIFESLAAEVPAFAGMTYKRMAGSPGLPVLEEAPHAS